jgi:PadR family transcriptional regulator PadR
MPGIEAGGLYGSLELLILQTLRRGGSMHGLEIADRIMSRCEGAFRIEEGSLYPALHRLQAKDYVSWEWMLTGERKRAKYYELTRSGERALARLRATWIRSMRAMLDLLEVAWEDVR